MPPSFENVPLNQSGIATRKRHQVKLCSNRRNILRIFVHRRGRRRRSPLRRGQQVVKKRLSEVIRGRVFSPGTGTFCHESNEFLSLPVRCDEHRFLGAIISDRWSSTIKWVRESMRRCFCRMAGEPVVFREWWRSFFEWTVTRWFRLSRRHPFDRQVLWPRPRLTFFLRQHRPLWGFCRGRRSL